MEYEEPTEIAGNPQHPARVLTTVKAWQFALHLASVYLLVYYGSVWLAGRFHAWILPAIDPTNQTSSFQFAFAHIFAFTFFPACVAGFVNSRFWPHNASYVWTIPAPILAYKFITFPTTVFQNHFDMAFHHYFGGGVPDCPVSQLQRHVSGCIESGHLERNRSTPDHRFLLRRFGI
jgi:hypothetical protein